MLRSPCLAFALLFSLSVGFSQSVIIDNGTPGYSEVLGSWTDSTSSGKYGANARYATTTGSSSVEPTAIAKWQAMLSQDGYYNVYAQYSQGTNRSLEAPYTITGDQGTTTVRISQQSGGGLFKYLKQVHFSATTSATVLLANNASGNVVMADAVKFTYVGSTPTPEPGAIDCGTGPLPSEAEFRGMWCSRFEWPKTTEAATKAKLDEVIDNTRSANFNSLFLQVRGQCDVLYPSPNEPWASQFNWTNPGYDPLAYAVEKAHAKGLELHAYINTHSIHQTVATNPQPPPSNLSPPHPYWLHGNPAGPNSDWCFVSSDGTTQALGLGEDAYVWAAPGVPSFQQWEREQILYVANTYNVDGVHFDRIRVSGTGSYDPTSLGRFNSRGNPHNLSYQNWNREQISRFLNDVYGAVAEVNANRGPSKPLIKVSTAPFRAQSQQLSVNQDLARWNSLGAQDFFAPQMYVSDLSTYAQHCISNMGISNGRFVIAGLGKSYAGSTCNLFSEINRGRELGLKGSVTFSYGGFSSDDFQAVKAHVFPNWVGTPDMPWLSAPTDAIVIGTVRNSQGSPVQDAWLSNSLVSNWTWLSGSDGFFSMLKVPASQAFTIRVTHPDGEKVVNVGPLAAGSVTRLNIVLSQSKGHVTFDKDVYGLPSSVKVSLIDGDLDGTGNAIVRVESSTEPAGEQVTLAENEPGSFEGTIALNAGPPQTDGILQAGHGDALIVRYSDADQGNGSPAEATDSATVDTQAPVITNVLVSSVLAKSALISFSTSEAATAVVKIGTSCGTLSTILPSTGSTAHSISVSNLEMSTTYHFAVSAVDAAGNTATDDNSGNCYEFTTRYAPVGLRDDCESSSVLDWTATGLWHIVTEDSVCSSAHSGMSSWYYGIEGQCNYDEKVRTWGTLMSPEFVIPENAEFRVFSREQTEGFANFDTRTVNLLIGELSITLVQSDNNTNTWYAMGPVDLGIYKGFTARLQFAFDSVDGVFNSFHGWNVDDVVVASPIPNVDAQVVSPVEENGTATLSGTVFDSDTNDTFTLTVNWGEGPESQDSLEIGGSDPGFQLTHKYYDDDPSGTPQDDYLVLIHVRDTTGKESTRETTVTVVNVNPTIDGPQLWHETVVEGTMSSLFFSFGDQGTSDTHTAAAEVETVSAPDIEKLPDSQTLHRVNYTFVDGTMNGPGDEREVKLRVTDDDGGAAEFTTMVTVLNSSPTWLGRSISAGAEGQQTSTHATFEDLGILDSCTARVDWGDGQISDKYFAPGAVKEFTMIHTYAQNGTYTVIMSVEDKDGGKCTYSEQIVVGNSAPTLSELSIASINEGSVTILRGSFSDPGTSDTFALDIAWGDGQTEIVNLAAGIRTFEVRHLYADDNPSGTPADSYDVKVVLADETGASASAQTTVMVTNVAPSAEITASVSGAVSLSGTISDVSPLDSFTVSINWGDMTEFQIIRVLADARTFTAEHTYAIPANYAVAVTVVDDDGGTFGWSQDVVLPTSADLVLSKTALPDPVAVGGDLVYSIVVTNAGPNAAADVVLVDEVPTSIELVKTTPGTCSNTGHVVTCSLGVIEAGTSKTVEIVAQSEVRGIVTNTASVTSSEPDPNPENNKASVTSTVGGKTDGADLTGAFFGTQFGCVAEKARKICAGKTGFLAQNIGNERVGKFHVRFYLSRDAVLDRSDKVVSSRLVRKLGAGESRNIKIKLKARPADRVEGWFIIAALDDNQKVAEGDETNNVVLLGPLLN